MTAAEVLDEWWDKRNMNFDIAIKAMKKYAEQKCLEQRIICAKKAKTRMWAQDPPQHTIDLSSIEHAPPPKFD